MELEERILQIMRELYGRYSNPGMDPSNEKWPITPQQLRDEVNRYGKYPS